MSNPIDVLETLGPMIIALHENDGSRAEWSKDFDDRIEELQAKYEALAEDAKNNAAAKRNMNAIAKGIPAFSKGVISAVQGFQNNDPLAGSAGVIDAVASVITTVASMSSAAGPPGAIVGAILSVVSMILKLFSGQKKSKSLAQQLEEVVRKLKGEEWMQNLKLVREKSVLFAESITPADYGTKTFASARADFQDNVIEGQKRLEDAAKWLEQEGNQELESWSVVLALQCFAYVAYTQALVMAMTLVKTEEDRKDFREDFFRTLAKQQLGFLQRILPVVRNRGTVWQADSHGYLYKRSVVVSAYDTEWKKCGAAEGGEDARIQSLAVAIRPRQGAASANPTLAQFSAESTFYHRNKFPKSTPYDQVKNTPFSSRGFERYKFQGRFGRAPFDKYYGVAMKTENTNHRKDLQQVYSVDTLPGREVHQVAVVTAHGSHLSFWKHGAKEHSEGAEQQLEYEGQSLMKGGYFVGQVRGVYPKHSPNIPGLPDFFDRNSVCAIYGACEVKAGSSVITNGFAHKGKDHMEIWASFRDYRFPNNPFRFYTQGAILSPWQNFIGVTADPHYVWVYRAGAIACTTHADIFACLNNGQAKPNWLVYHIPHEGISKESYDPETAIVDVGGFVGNMVKRGLQDLDACEDGTLTAIFSDAFDPAIGEIPTHIYKMVPQIDLQAKTLKISGTKDDNMGHPVPTSGWTTDRSSAKAYRIVKHPIFCWSVYDSLRQSLEEVEAVHKEVAAVHT